MNQRSVWDALQTRWASGQPLSLDEERARRAYARTDPLARRELEIFDALRESAQSAPAPHSAELVGRVLRVARGSPLRLVVGDERPSTPREHESVRSRPSLRAFALAALALSLVLGLGSLAVQRARAPVSSAVPSASTPAPLETRFNSARSELVFTSGRVLVGGVTRAFGASTLAPGEVLSTEDGQACFTIDPSIDLCMAAKTSVLLESLAPQRILIRVERGALVASLTPRAKDHVFTLAGREVLATARGTVFALESDPERATERISVLEGSVAVARGRERSELVPAHTELTFENGAPARGFVIGRSKEARLLSLLAPRELWQGAGLGTLEIPERTRGTRVLIDGKGPFGLPLSVFVRAGEHRVVVRSQAGEERELTASVELGATRRIDLPAPLAPSAPRLAPPPTVLLEEARAKLSKGDVRGARALYVELRSAHPKSPEAATVLVTLGRLELELGAPARALRSFELYLECGGPLAPEALAGKIQALRALARTPEERSAIEQYLAQYGSGFAAPVLRKRLAELKGP